jgi:Oxidoreductase family, NAD-binding Rossmann fold
MAKVRVGLVGCGFAAELHMYAYQRVYGVDAQVTARGDHVLDFAKKHQIRRTYRDFQSLMADKEVDVIDICTPPALHASMIVESRTKPRGSHRPQREGDRCLVRSQLILPIGKPRPPNLAELERLRLQTRLEAPSGLNNGQPILQA